VFDRVREEWPNFHEKIKPICAEFTKPNLAISSEDMEELLSEVNVIFHCAAAVRFNEPLNMRRHNNPSFRLEFITRFRFLHGWIDNFNNINGFLVAAAKGVVRTVKCNPTNVADVIPVDLAVNLTITVGWYTAVHRPKSPLIYNYTSGGLNPLYWGDLEMNATSSFDKNPLEKPFRIPEVTLTSSHLVHQYRLFVYHTSPAFLYDLHLRLIGKKPQLMKLLTRIEKSMRLLEYFTSHSWEWSSGHTNMLMKELSPKDKNKYLLNEDMAGIPAAQQYIRKLKTIHCALKATLLVIIWRIFIARSQMAHNVWYFVLSLCYKFLSYIRVFSTLRL
ncbi:Fatty acyl-CoA reductase 1, partial [Ophiophagus hannah]